MHDVLLTRDNSHSYQLRLLRERNLRNWFTRPEAMFVGLRLVTHAALGLFEALHTLLHLKVSDMLGCDCILFEVCSDRLLRRRLSVFSVFVQVLLSFPPRYSVADLRTRFWYFVSDAATVPLSLLALSYGLTDTSLRRLLISSVLGASSYIVPDRLLPTYCCSYQQCVPVCQINDPCCITRVVSQAGRKEPDQKACAACRACSPASSVRLGMAERGGSDAATARA